MRRLAFVLSLFLVMALATAALATVNLPFADDFEDGDAAGWVEVSGDWSVVDGEYRQTHLGDNGGATPYGWDMHALVSGGPTDAYVVEVDARLIEYDVTDPNYIGWWGVVFRYENSSRFATIAFGEIWFAGYTRDLEQWDYVDGDWVWVGGADLDALPNPWTPYEWHRLKIVVNGNDVKTFVDGNLLMETTDPTGLSGGSVGVFTDGASAAFDNWEFHSLTPEAALDDLIGDVEQLNLENGVSNSLDAKLTNVVKALSDVNDNNDIAAVNKIEAFINEVEAQAGKQIPRSDADALIAAAQQIINLLTGG